MSAMVAILGGRARLVACPLPEPPRSSLSCLINQWTAAHDRNVKGTAGDLWRCLECEAGERLLHSETYQTYLGKGQARVLAVAPAGEDTGATGKGAKKAEVGREGRDLAVMVSSFSDPGGTPALKGVKSLAKPRLDRDTKKIIKELAKPAPAFCKICGAPGYGQSGLCFEHLRAETERKSALARARQARHAKKKKRTAGEDTCATRPKTEFYPLNASPAVRRAFEGK